MAVLTPTSNPASIAAVQDILREVWVADTLETQLYEDTVLLDYIEEVTEYTDSDGLKASVPLRVGRTGGVSARGVGEQLGPADHQRPGKASYNYKNLYLQVAVQGPVVARMETSRQSAVREIDLEVKGGIEDFKRDFCRQLHMGGDAVLTLAGLPGGASSTTVLLSAANYPLIERGFLYEGQLIDIGTVANPQLDVGGARIASVVDSVSAPAIVLEAATATTAASHISLFGNRTAANGSSEVNGLENIISTSAILGAIDPTAVGKGYWKAVVDANGGTPRAISLALLNGTRRKLRQKGSDADTYIASLGMEQKYYELLQTQVRYIGDTNLASGKVEGPTHNGITMRGDPDALPGRVSMIKKGVLQMYSAGDIAWQNQTAGGDILAWKQDFDAFVGRAAKYCQVGTNRRNSLARLADLTEPT